MPVETLKYDFRFNREEAEVMLEVLEHWNKNFTSGLENPYDWKDRNRMETELKTTNLLIKKITHQSNTKKVVLNFITVRYTLNHLSSCLNVNPFEKIISDSKNPQELNKIQQKIEICKVLVKRIRELPYIGEPNILIQMRKATDGNFNLN